METTNEPILKQQREMVESVKQTSFSRKTGKNNQYLMCK